MAPTPTFYLFYGDDDIARAEAVNKIRAAMGDGTEADMNISEFDGDAVSVPEVLNAVRSFPFLADKRLVIVTGLLAALGAQGEAGKKGLARLVDEVPSLPDYARFVLVERETIRKDNKLLKLAQDHDRAYVREYSAPKDPTQWIIRRAKSEYSSEIEPVAASALASVTGGDLRRADNELVKLVTYIDDAAQTITEDHVALLTPYVAEANVFDMVDALAAGDGEKALRLMHQALEQDPSDPGFRLFALFVRQFRLLLLAREHLDNGGSANPSDIAAVLGIHPYPAGKVAVQSRRFDVAALERIYRRLQQYDHDMKTGRIAAPLALDLLVASLSK